MMKGIVCLSLMAAMTGFAQAPVQDQRPAPARSATNTVSPDLRLMQERRLQTNGLPASALPPDQLAKLQQANSEHQREQSAQYMKMGQIRRELDELTKAEPLDENAVRAKALEIGKIEGELALLRAKHVKRIGAILPKEQFERLQQQGTLARPQVQPRLNTVVERPAPPATRPPTPPTNAVQSRPSTPAPR